MLPAISLLVIPKMLKFYPSLQYYPSLRNIPTPIQSALLTILLLSSITIYSQPTNDARAWQSDLDFLAQAIREGHPDPFANMDRRAFDQAVARLHKKIPPLKRHEIIVEFARIVAMLRDGHSALGFTWDDKIAFKRLPIRFYLYSDGLFVQSATKENEKFLGAKVIRIGKMSVDDALERIRPIIHGDNEMAFKDIVTSRLSMPEVLQALRITEDQQEASFEFEMKDAGRITTTVKAIPAGVSVQLIPARTRSTNPLPLYLKNPQANYWFEYLEGPRIVYVKFNAVQNSDEESISAFFARVFKFVDANPVDKFILDMRHNNGGDNTLIKPIIHGIIKSDKINQRGKLFTVIGRLTFSAAQNTVNELEKHTNTLFVGEPTEGRPNHFGDAVNYVLPNSKIIARISQLRWQDQHPTDNRPWVAPQIAAELSSDDYLTNRDPVFEAILRYSEVESITNKLLEILNAKAPDHYGAMNAYVRSFQARPEHKFYDTEKELTDLGSELQDMKRANEAIDVLKLNAELHPTSSNAYRNLAEIYEQNGHPDQASENYLKSNELEKRPNLKFWLRQKIRKK